MATQTENDTRWSACQTFEIIKWSKYYSQSKSDAYCFKHIVIFRTGRLWLCLSLSLNLMLCLWFCCSKFSYIFLFLFNKRLQAYDNKQILMEYFSEAKQWHRELVTARTTRWQKWLCSLNGRVNWGAARHPQSQPKVNGSKWVSRAERGRPINITCETLARSF